MPSYSNRQFYEDWRYALETDFTKSDGITPIPYAENGDQEWGDEIRKLECGEDTPHDGCISADWKYLAIAAGINIYVFDTQTWTTVVVLEGHVSRISSVAFNPADSNILVSSEEGDYGRVDFDVEPTIYIWDIEHHIKNPKPIADEDALNNVSAAATSTVVDKFAELGLSLSEEGIKELDASLAPVIKRGARKSFVSSSQRLKGRLCTNFQSEVFSHFGKWMAYLPGRRPSSNGKDDGWVINIISTSDPKETFTLRGHEDSITWTGWSSDDSVFASVSWDKTVRIWDMTTRAEKYKFETHGQNWTGAFSKDGKFFASTCGSGKGTMQVYDLTNGTTKWVHEATEASQWRRALDWHPSGRFLAVGGDSMGDLRIYDVAEQKVLQTRTFSSSSLNIHGETVPRMMIRYLGTKEVKYMQGGKKLAVWTAGDCSAEVYDMEKEVKWRFARGGTGDGPKSHEWRDEKGRSRAKGVAASRLGRHQGL
jgi:WD40 repeat protein